MPLDLAEFGKKLSRCRTQLQLSIADVSKSTGFPADRVKAFEEASPTPAGDDILGRLKAEVVGDRFHLRVFEGASDNPQQVPDLVGAGGFGFEPPVFSPFF